MTLLSADILTRLLLALAAGGLIGLERAYHGRPAGFRTHSLVCIASSLLMLLMVYQWQLVPAAYMETVRVDPTRMAQGIMTGIGFLGAGVIMKENLTIRGLTTAASIWMTASIGIVIGMGFYSASIAAALLTIMVLSVFHKIEKKMPTHRYGRLTLRFPGSVFLQEDEVRALINAHDISAVNPSYSLEGANDMFQYQFIIRTSDTANFRHLADALRMHDAIRDFSIVPVGD
jgi:putative Mg2+ transporter-C (MgtC) family protein